MVSFTRQCGSMILPVTLIVAVLVAFMLLAASLQNKRRNDVLRNQVELEALDRSSRQMDLILSALRQCTCNLRGLTVANLASGGGVAATEPGGARSRFGFYRLDLTDVCPAENDVPDSGLVLAVASSRTGVDPRAAVVSRVSVENFVPDGAAYADGSVTPAETIQRYRAEFKFAVSADQQRARRSDNRRSIPVNVEVRTADNTIRGCYWPSAPANRLPIPNCSGLSFNSNGVTVIGPPRTWFPGEIIQEYRYLSGPAECQQKCNQTPGTRFCMVANTASGACDSSNNPFDPLNPSCVEFCYAFGGDQVQLVTNPGWGGFFYGAVSCDN